MPVWLRRLALLALVLFIASFAYAPILGANLAAGDFRTLVESQRIADGGPDGPEGLAERASALFEVHGTEGHPLAALSLVISTELWAGRAGSSGRTGRSATWADVSPAPLRLQNLTLVLLAALGMSLALRRLLWPWTGSEQARSAGWAGGLLFLLAPFQTATVASLDARGDLLALVLGSIAAVLFLRGRQEHKYPLLVVAGLFTAGAGLCSDLALVLPPLLAVAEFASARRYRPRHVRARTALTTLLVFGACVALQTVLASVQAGAFVLPEPLLALGRAESWQSPGLGLGIHLERFGSLLLPVNAHAAGTLGLGFAGLLLLAALQPALSAARAAPRMWGWLLIGGLAAAAACELVSPWRRVHPEDVTHAATLLGTMVVSSLGLGIASTSMRGLRRSALPLILALGYGLLGQVGARAWSVAAEEVELLNSDLAAGRLKLGHGPGLLVIDPPGAVHGVDALAGALPWMLDPLFARGAEGTEPMLAPPPAPPWVRTLSLEAFLALAREPEFDRLRARELIVVFPARHLARAESGQEGGGREAALLGSAEPTRGARTWFREGRSPVLDIEPVQTHALSVTGVTDAQTDRPPVLAWQSRSTQLEQLQENRHEGAWLSTDQAPDALFDLSASLAWVLGERVRQVWPDAGWTLIGEATVLDELPPPALERAPRVVDGDWVFDDPSRTLARARGEWVLGLLDLAGYGYVELAGVATSQGLSVPDAARRVAAALSERGGPVVWSLERRIDGHAVERARGRRAGRGP